MPLFDAIKFDGLGTHWECEIIDSGFLEKDYDSIRRLLIERLNEFTKLYSRFDDNSLIGQLNREFYIINPPSEFLKMLRFAKKMFEATGGVFNISVGGELNKKGYGKVENSALVISDFWDHVVLTSRRITIPKNCVIDFGGFGKGWLIDEFVRILHNYGVRNFIVNGGGDLYVNSDVPINILLEHPSDSSKSIGQTLIEKGALAASSTIKRSWEKDGQIFNHLINPTNGDSSLSGAVASFVRADSALIADVMATVLIIKPDLNESLSKAFGLKVIIISEDQIKN